MPVAAVQISSADTELTGLYIKVHNVAVIESSCNTDIIKWSLVVIINIRPKFNPKSCVLLDVLFVMYPGHIQKVLRRMRTSGQ